MASNPGTGNNGALIVRITLYIGLAIVIALSSGRVDLGQIVSIVPANSPRDMVLSVLLVSLTAAVITSIQFNTSEPPLKLVRYEIKTTTKNKSWEDLKLAAINVIFNAVLILVLLGFVGGLAQKYGGFATGRSYYTVLWYLLVYVALVGVTRRLTWMIQTYFGILSLFLYSVAMIYSLELLGA